MNKKKKIADTYKSDLHAILEMPLELAYEALMTYENPNTMIASEWLDDDRILINIIPRQKIWGIDVMVHGTLRRWQGNLTRIQFNSKVDITGEWAEGCLSFVPFAMTVAFIYFIMTGCSFVIYAFVGDNYSQILFLIAVVIALLFHNRMPIVELFKSRRTSAIYAVDDLMQTIANALTSVSNNHFYEYDGTEDALSRLLAQHDFGQRQIGNDGELL